MDDDVPGVDQDPIAVREALGGGLAMAVLLECLEQALSHRHHLALRASGGDDHVIGDAGFALEVDDDKIFGLAVCEGLLGKVEKRLRLCRDGVRPGLDARYGGHLLFAAVRRPFPLRRGAPSERISVAELVSSILGRNAQTGGASSARRLAASGAALCRSYRFSASSASPFNQ